MNELDRHLDVYDDYHIGGYPRRIPIDKKPPLESCSKPFDLQVGDLVCWASAVSKSKKKHQGNWFAERFGENATGLVLDTRWMLTDWDAKGVTSNTEEWRYVAEAAIMWSNGELTNSSFGALKRTSRAK
jgi:hypothetical protein